MNAAFEHVRNCVVCGTLAGMNEHDTPGSVKVTVFMERGLHREAKLAAMDDRTSLSRWIEDLVRKHLSRKHKSTVRSGS